MTPIEQQMAMMTQQQMLTQPQPSGMRFQNPLQLANYIFQSLRNPASFIKQQFPDVPDDIMNNSDQILAYIQKTRGISNDQIRQIMCQYPMIK